MNRNVINLGDKKHKKNLPYRPCVGVMLLNKQGKVFIGNRLQSKTSNDVVPADYTWQMPQGGIDEGEEALEAAYRELYEETNIRSIKVLAQIPDWLTYDLPEEQIGIAFKGKYCGQKQKWFAMRFLGDDTEIDVQNPGGGSCKPEFSSWRWEDAPHLPGLIIPFKRKVYEQVISQFEVLTRV